MNICVRVLAIYVFTVIYVHRRLRYCKWMVIFWIDAVVDVYIIRDCFELCRVPIVRNEWHSAMFVVYPMCIMCEQKKLLLWHESAIFLNAEYIVIKVNNNYTFIVITNYEVIFDSRYIAIFVVYSDTKYFITSVCDM